VGGRSQQVRVSGAGKAHASTGNSDRIQTKASPCNIAQSAKSGYGRLCLLDIQGSSGDGPDELVQEGAIDLNRPVLQYDSSLAFSDPVAGCEITLRQLLSHTSGLDDTHQIEPQPRRCLPFVARPARAFRYSNVGFDVGVLTAAQQCGVSYENLLRTRVLSPLAMKAMHWRPGFAFATPFTPARDLMLLAEE
jgi:Beta-lactamase